MSSKYPSLKKGDRFKHESGHIAIVDENVDTFGKSTMELDTTFVRIKWDDGQSGIEPLEMFGGTSTLFEKVEQ